MYLLRRVRTRALYRHCIVATCPTNTKNAVCTALSFGKTKACYDGRRMKVDIKRSNAQRLMPRTRVSARFRSLQKSKPSFSRGSKSPGLQLARLTVLMESGHLTCKVRVCTHGSASAVVGRFMVWRSPPNRGFRASRTEARSYRQSTAVALLNRFPIYFVGCCVRRHLGNEDT